MRKLVKNQAKKLTVFFLTLAIISLAQSFFFTTEFFIEKELIIINDTSGSTSFASEDLNRYISPLKPDNLQVINTAANAITVYQGKYTGKSEFPRTTINHDQTNLAKGILLALAGNKSAGKFSRKRFLIFTDGYQTRDNVETILKENKLFAEVIPTGQPPAEDAAIIKVITPSQTQVSQPFKVRVLARSTSRKPATIWLKSSDKIIAAKEKLIIPAAGSIHDFSITINKPGINLISAHILSPLDMVEQNNQASTAVSVRDNSQILWAGHKLPKIFDYNPSYIKATQINRNILSKHSFLVLNNIPATEIVEQTSAISDFVSNGGNLLIIGGPQTLAAGGWLNTELEKLSPVEIIPADNLAVIFAVDTSGSMSEKQGLSSRLSLAQQAVSAAIARLSPQDSYGVITFTTTADAVIPLRKKSAANHNSFLLNSSAQGGTSIFSAIDLGGKLLTDSKAQNKHIILITDGQTQERKNELQNSIKNVRKALFAKTVGLSVITIGKSPQEEELEKLCKGLGEVDTSDENLISLPALLHKQLEDSRSDFILPLETVDISKSEKLTIYNTAALGSPKNPKLTTVLIRSNAGNILAARGFYGLGRVTLLSSSPWIGWQPQSLAEPIFRSIFANFISTTSDNAVVYTSGNTIQVDFKPEITTASSFYAEIINHNTITADFPLQVNESGLWSGKSTLDTKGNYLLRIIPSESESGKRNLAESVALPVFVNDNAEYLNFGADGAKLGAIAEAGGAKVVMRPENLSPWQNVAPTGPYPAASSIFILLALFFALASLVIMLYTRYQNRAN